MPSPEELLILNEFVQFLLAGKVKEGDQKPKPVKLEPDRSLSVFSQLAALQDGKRRIIQADPNGLLRIRPYEPQHPLEAVVLTVGAQTIYTATDAEARVWAEVVNTTSSSATCTVKRYVNSGSTGFEVLPAGTPVPQGVGVRVGPYDLLDTGYITAACSPASACNIHLTIDQFATAGDTP